MAQISTFLANRLRDGLRKKPLEPDELRPIEIMAGYFIAESPVYHGISYLFTLELDGVTVYIFKIPADQLPNGS